MDELAEIKAMIETFRETLTFLVEQEKIRGEEVNALNDKIEAVLDAIRVYGAIDDVVVVMNNEDYRIMANEIADKTYFTKANGCSDCLVSFDFLKKNCSNR